MCTDIITQKDTNQVKCVDSLPRLGPLPPAPSSRPGNKDVDARSLMGRGFREAPLRGRRGKQSTGCATELVATAGAGLEVWWGCEAGVPGQDSAGHAST